MTIFMVSVIRLHSRPYKPSARLEKRVAEQEAN
jgi:hypothetical protein